MIIVTVHHQNHDGLSLFRGFTIIKIMTSLLTTYLQGVSPFAATPHTLARSAGSKPKRRTDDRAGYWYSMFNVKK